MSLEHYAQALRAGQKEYRARVANGDSPYLAVLDDILVNTSIVTQESLGLVDIPMELIAGTKTSGRHTAFAPNYMPLLGLETEFASKWSNLCDAHLQEGINVPIQAYEFMNRFYVAEGNKRVSVLKYYGAVSIIGTVTRLVPARSDSLENRIYYEFLDFNRLSGLNTVWFTREGGFAELQKGLCKAAGESWTGDDRKNFNSFYAAFRAQFNALGGPALGLTAGDAAVAFLKVHRWADAADAAPALLLRQLEAMWDEIRILAHPQAVDVQLDPAAPAEKNVLTRLLPSISGRTSELKVVFLHENGDAASAWTHAHGVGRRVLEQQFPGRVVTSHVDYVQPGVDDETRLEAAVRNGADVIFTTASQMMPACLKVAARHPSVKILNCSLAMPHPSVRTYYGRMYEAKYLMGLVAGILSKSERIGYLASYPVYGVPASINAFALGVRAVRPEARVVLRWSCLENDPLPPDFSDRDDISVFSGRDEREPKGINRDYGLCRRSADGSLQDLAVPIWRWGRIYSEIIRSILDGTWDSESTAGHAINYWWGMRTGAVSIRYADIVPAGTLQLVQLAESRLRGGDYIIFPSVFTDQIGTAHLPAAKTFSPEELIRMDWLAENVEGCIPPPDSLTRKAQQLVSLQGLGAASAL